MKKGVIFLCLIWVGYLPTYAQPKSMKFQSLSIQEGFPSANVWSILRDSRGFMWFGTMDGLIRYDGVDYQVYYPDKTDSTKLYEGFIHHLFEDSKGRIWLSAGVVPHSQIIQVFNPKTERFIRFDFTVSINANNSTKFNAQNYILEDETGTIWIKSRYSGLYKIEEKSSEQFSVRYFQLPLKNLDKLPGGDIHVLFIDSRKKFWVGTKNGLYLFDRCLEKFIKFQDNKDEMPDHAIGIAEDSNGNLWINYERRGLYLLNPETNSFIEKWPVPNHTVKAFNDRYIILDNSENIWMLKQKEQGEYISLDRYDISTDKTHRYFKENSQNYHIVPQLDDEGNLWVLKDRSLYSFNPESDALELAHEFSSSIDYFAIDKHQNVWISNPSDGLLKYHYSNKKTKKLTNEFLFYNFPWRSTCIEDASGNILVANEKGVIKYTLNTNQEVINKEFILHDKHCYNLSQDNRGNILTPCFDQGKIKIFRITPGFYEINNFLLPLNPNFDPNSSERGNISLKPDSFDLSHFQLPPDANFIANSVAEVNSEEIIATTMFNGFFLYDQETRKFIQFLHDPNESASISSNVLNQVVIDNENRVWLFNRIGVDLFNTEQKNIINIYKGLLEKFGYILDIYEHGNGQFWLAGIYGLVLFEPMTGKVHKSYFVRDGFPTKDIRKIVSDDDGNLWLGTETGLVYFNVEKEHFKKFDTSDGLPSNRVYAGTKRKNGELVFGGDKGLFIFHPNKFPLNEFPPNPVFTDFRLFNKEVNIDGKILSKSISYTDEIVLNHDQNVLSFTYSALSFANPDKNQYAYFMEGIDKDWNYVGNQTFASYAGLTPGKYVLNLKASNNDGLWNETPTTLAITILPPWWQAWWAYCLYGLLALGAVLFLRHYEIKRLKLRQRAAHLSEMDTFKSRFYTNITHEFRTPLTVILGMTDQADQLYQKSKSLIKRNALYLLQLVNQMLDLSRLEAGMLTVHLQQGNIIPYIRYIVESFHSLAEHKDIHIHFRSEVPELIMDYDADKVLNIVSNLLSNAIKFTPEGGHVSLVVSQIQEHHASKFHLRITDTGMGIPADQLPHIFDRFYQMDDSTTQKGEGTGIGLSLTQELVRLLNGTIAVKSTVWQGTEFTIELPIANAAPMTEVNKNAQSAIAWTTNQEDNLNEILPPTSEKRSQPVALIVEDNVDVVYYLRTCLQGKYTLEVAQNGQNGIHKALESLPDIIISDIMMPEKNGYELCKTLKNHEKTSHIPIILLTAKAGEEDKLEGLEAGADAYLTKPFNKKELKLRIKNLIAHRKKLWSQYNESFPYNPQELEVSSHDQQFLTKALEVLEEHKAEADFSAESLQKELGVSRTLLHVKLKALTGQSTSEFIRTYRLKYAAQLIQQQFGNIAQVAYEAGFNDQSYFTKTFKKHFGVAPSEYAKSASV